MYTCVSDLGLSIHVCSHNESLCLCFRRNLIRFCAVDVPIDYPSSTVRHRSCHVVHPFLYVIFILMLGIVLGVVRLCVRGWLVVP